MFGKLQVDAIIGTEFIDRHVQDIHVQDRSIEIMDGTVVPILRTSIGNTLTDDPVTGTPAFEHSGKVKAQPAPNKLRVPILVVLPPHSQTWVPVVAKRRGPIVIETNSYLDNTQFVSA